VTRFCVQSAGDRERLLGLGVDAAQVVVTGSLKGDGRLAPSPAFLALIRELGRPLVIAGSTHEGEERMVLGALRLLGGAEPRPFWILAPRHPERFDGVAGLLEHERVRFVRRTGLPREPGLVRAALETADLLLLDSIGELAGCYPAASACFIGGSLVPIGGHNLLEPARCGVPIVVGPHLDSVRELAARLEAVGAAVIVQEPGGLARALADLIERGDRDATGRAAREVAEELAGSLARTWACLEEAVGKGAP
jgi:3-deoxy-D-manno-octulosonic-acid transferase